MKRSKVNRRKTVKRRPKLPTIRLNWRAILLPPALFSVLAGAFIATQAVLDRPVDKLRLEGVFRRVTALQVEAALAPALNRGFFSTDLSQLQRLVAELDWVDEVEIARVWPDTLAVRVSEHQAAARWGESGLLNTRGELFTQEARYEFPELPRLAGPMGRETLAGLGLNSVQAKRLRRTLEPVQPVVVVACDAQTADAQAAVASAPAVGGFASPAAK